MQLPNNKVIQEANKSPFYKKWGFVYAAVLAFLVIQILFYYFFSQITA